MKELVKWIDCNDLQVTVNSVRLAKKKAFLFIEAGNKMFTITVTRNSAKKILRA